MLLLYIVIVIVAYIVIFIVAYIVVIYHSLLQVNGLIICGRLKDAYIESLKGERVNEIERILLEAKRVNQRHVVDICQKYLANYKEKQERKARLR